MNFEIELRPHIGQCTSTGQPVELNQYLIVVTGPDLQKVRGKPEEMIGYVGKDAGNPINYLKVAAVFGEPTVKVFSQMIRTALLAKAKERVMAAQAASKEARKLREETEEFIAQQQQAGEDESAARDAMRLVDDAIAAANQDLVEADQIVLAEQAANREVSEPDSFYAEANGQSGESLPVDRASGGSDDGTMSSEADSQNL